jgi:predicted SnoaL-like aldol condensation-catalyzing enzyme
MLDNEILHILEKARKQVEGPSRGVPYSDIKLKAYSSLKY